jgi:hypothetical protein
MAVDVEGIGRDVYREVYRDLNIKLCCPLDLISDLIAPPHQVEATKMALEKCAQIASGAKWPPWRGLMALIISKKPLISPENCHLQISTSTQLAMTC